MDNNTANLDINTVQEIKVNVNNVDNIICTLCKLSLTINDFTKSGKDKYGNVKHRKQCRNCCKSLYNKDKDRILKQRKTKRVTEGDKIRAYFKNYHTNNKEKIHSLQKKYRDANPEKERMRKIVYYNKYPEKLFVKYTRSRVHSMVKTGKGNIEWLGCDALFLLKWLRFCISFDKKMTIDNHGSYWHIDHVIPCAKWDMNITLHKKLCFHWTNLSPLEAMENITKGDKIIHSYIEEQNKKIKLFAELNKTTYPLLSLELIAKPTIAGNS